MSHSHPRGPSCQHKRYVETAHLISFANLPHVEFMSWAWVSAQSALHLQSLLKQCRVLTLLKHSLSWQLDTEFSYLIFFVQSHKNLWSNYFILPSSYHYPHPSSDAAIWPVSVTTSSPSVAVESFTNCDVTVCQGLLSSCCHQQWGSLFFRQVDVRNCEEYDWTQLQASNLVWRFHGRQHKTKSLMFGSAGPCCL